MFLHISIDKTVIGDQGTKKEWLGWGKGHQACVRKVEKLARSSCKWDTTLLDIYFPIWSCFLVYKPLEAIGIDCLYMSFRTNLLCLLLNIQPNKSTMSECFPQPSVCLESFSLHFKRRPFMVCPGPADSSVFRVRMCHEGGQRPGSWSSCSKHIAGWPESLCQSEPHFL